MFKSLLNFNNFVFLIAVIVMPTIAFSECTELKIIDKGESLEAVCVGNTAAQTAQPSVSIKAGDMLFKRGVVFPHKSHQSNYQCSVCHNTDPGKINEFGKDYAHTKLGTFVN